MSSSVPLKWVLAGLGVGVSLIGFLSFAYITEKKNKHKEREKRKVLNLIQHNFERKHLEILKYMQKQDWNNFDIPTLKKVYDHFQKYCETPTHGILSRKEFRDLHRAIGLKDEQVIESLFRFWDGNADGSVDFYELVEGLNLFCFGTKARKLQRFFRVFDLDLNGFITRNELKQLFSAFFDTEDEKLVEESVRKIFAAVDDNHDARLSFKEFVSLSTLNEFELDCTKPGFNLKFIKLFGLSEKDITVQTPVE